MDTAFSTRSRLVALSITLALTAAAACGGSSPGTFNGSGGGTGSNGGSGSTSGPTASLGGAQGGSSGTTESCAGSEGQTRACCVTGTQTCSSGEVNVWGPCLDSNGNTLTCNGTGGGGSEDAGGAGTGGGGNEDAGGAGSGGGGNEDAGGGTGGGGHEDAGQQPSLCTNPVVNTEPDILAGYFPAAGQTVSGTGQIKIWATDEAAPKISAGEVVDPNTGAITTPGDRTAKAPDGYLWEPALYIAPQTAETGGTPFFPQFIKGSYDNNPTSLGFGQPPTATVPGMDPAPNPPPGAGFFTFYTAEYIWNVSDLGLSSGTYWAEFVIHDGDRDRAVGCVTIVVQ